MEVVGSKTWMKLLRCSPKRHEIQRTDNELGRLAQDLAGGLVATMPSEKELDHPKIGALCSG